MCCRWERQQLLFELILGNLMAGLMRWKACYPNNGYFFYDLFLYLPLLIHNYFKATICIVKFLLNLSLL